MSDHPTYPIRHGIPAMDRCICGGVRHWHAVEPNGCDDCDCEAFYLDESWRPPALPLPEPPRREMGSHTAKLTVEEGQAQWKFTCHAEVGAPCRKACGECEDSCLHERIDQGECMEILWLENDDALLECQVGAFAAWEGPVDIRWDGKNEYYEFEPSPVSPLPLTRERIDAAIASVLDGWEGYHPQEAKLAMNFLCDALLKEGE